MKILWILSLVLAATATPLSIQKWTEFKLAHQKQYSSPGEEAKRLKIFTENLAKIEAHNVRYEKGEVTYSKAMNKFGDWTAEEFLAFVNSTRFQKPRLAKAPPKLHLNRRLAEDEVDWRTKGAVTEVGTEGDCGASWSFSALGALEGQLAIKTGQLVALSSQNLLDCSADYGNGACEGGLTHSAYDYIQDNGIMSESDYPYEGQQGSCRFDSSKSVTKISGYQDVDYMSETSLQTTVATIGPVASAVHATDNLQFYYGGIFFDDTCNLSLTDLNHGVLIVGYGTELQYDYWIVKNSWGTDWGENGFYKSIRNYGNNCGIATSCSYPVL
jgi:cathepsin L